MSFEQICIAIGFLLIISVYANKLSSKLGIPALLLFLAIGMLAGSEGLGGINFNSYTSAKLIGDIALIFILFSGGLNTQWKTIRPILWQGLTLSTIGVALTMIFVGTFTWLILGSFSSFSVGTNGISWLEGLLLGAIISSTDAAAVFSILKTSKLGLKENLQPLLELESGSNDPMAVLLTATFVRIIATSQGSILELVISLVMQLTLGTLVGYGFGRGISWSINRFDSDDKGLYPVSMIAKVILTYGVATIVHGNGFLAVYVAGVVLGNRQFAYKQTITDFHDGIDWLMQITMFLSLGLLVFPSQLLPIAPIAIVIALFLILVARPISVFMSLLFTKMSLQEKLFISWVGLRGAVPIILAISPITAGIADGRTIFNIVFFIVLISVSVQGLTLAPMARWLRLTVNDRV